MKQRFLLWRADAAAVAAGAFLFSMSMNLFFLPAGIVLGGATGLASVLASFFPVPIGLTILFLNIPLLIAGARRCGKRFLIRTLIGVASTSLAIDLLPVFPVTLKDPLLCAVFGGLTMGAGAGILLSRGITTGGTDLAAWLLKRRFPRLSAGLLIMLLDLGIILGAAVLTGKADGIFYSVVSVFLMGRMTDWMMAGARRSILVLVVSDRAEEMMAHLFRATGRGITLLEARGGYTGRVRPVLMCVLRRHELYDFKRCAAKVDRRAFITVTEASDVLGEGFDEDPAAEDPDSPGEN